MKLGLRTKTVELRGPTTVIFCSTKLNPDDQEKTRLLFLSPEVDQEKLEEALKLIALKESDPEAYRETVGSDPRRLFLEKLAQDVWASGVKRVKLEGDLYGEFVSRHPVHKPKHQRDLPRVASLVKAHALLNHGLRELEEDGTLLATEEDMKAGFALYEKVSLPNELGISPYVLEIYEKEIRPLFGQEGVSRKDVYQAHFKRTGRTANQQWYEKEIFPSLTTAGLIVEEPDPDNRRRYLIYPPDPTMVLGAKIAPISPKDSESRLDYHSEVRGVSGNPEDKP